MLKICFIGSLLMAGMAYGADEKDPFAKHRIDMHTIPLLTQEIIKLHLKHKGVQFFDAEQKRAEEEAAAYNKAQTENVDADGECGFAWRVPSWGLTTTFYAANKETDLLTNMVYEAAKPKAKSEQTAEQRIAHRTRLTVQADGSIQAYTRMGGYPYMWAKEYSKNNTI